jgi:hypothetical protein
VIQFEAGNAGSTPPWEGIAHAVFQEQLPYTINGVGPDTGIEVDKHALGRQAGALL